MFLSDSKDAGLVATKFGAAEEDTAKYHTKAARI